MNSASDILTISQRGRSSRKPVWIGSDFPIRFPSLAMRTFAFPKMPCAIAVIFLLGLCTAAPADIYAGPNNHTQSGQGSGEVRDFAAAMFTLATQTRATPVTEPGIPIQQVTGQWAETLLKLTDDTYVLTEKLDPQYKFYVQAILCTHGPGKVKAQFSKEWATFEKTTDAGPEQAAALWDATFLGVRETATTFYEANIAFKKFDLSFTNCMPVGMLVMQQPRGSQTVASDERVLEHMCNWLRFLTSMGDTRRSEDFLNIILSKEKEALLEENSNEDWRRLAADMDFFDSVFPFAVFDTTRFLAADTRTQAREFLQTTIQLRKKLFLFSPGASQLISRDEKLLQSLR